MKSLDFIKEDIVTDAQDAHVDHEVQMARSDCFHAAEDALTLHRLLRTVPESVGLEGWVAAKITLAADYLNTVREYLEYQLNTGDARPENADLVIVGETAGVTDYDPKSHGGTRKELLAKYHKTKNPKDAEAARRAGATEKELQGVAEGSLSEGFLDGAKNKIKSLYQSEVKLNPNFARIFSNVQQNKSLIDKVINDLKQQQLRQKSKLSSNQIIDIIKTDIGSLQESNDPYWDEADASSQDLQSNLTDLGKTVKLGLLTYVIGIGISVIAFAEDHSMSGLIVMAVTFIIGWFLEQELKFKKQSTNIAIARRNLAYKNYYNSIGQEPPPDIPYQKESVEHGVAEGAYEDSPVANAITRRIMMQRTDLLSKYGPGYVTQAIDDVVDAVGDWDEIGSSDVSGWVRQVEWNLKNKLNQYDEPMDVGDALDESEDAKVYQDKRTGQYVAWIRDGKDNIIKGEGATPEEASAELQKLLAARSQKVVQRTQPEADRRYSSWISNYIVRNLLQRGKDNSPVYALVKNGKLYASAKPVAGFKTANYDRQNEQGGGFQIWLTGKEISGAGLNASTRYLAKQIDDANGVLVFSLTPHSTIVSSNDKVSLNHVPSLVIQHTGRNVVAEMSAGSVATVVNPPAKNKAKVGTLFGGTYQQKKVGKGKK